MAAESMENKGASKRGIPPMNFIDDVESYVWQEAGLKSADPTQLEMAVRAAIGKLEQTLSKYRYAEANMTAQRARLRDKLPELRQSLRLLSVLEQQRGRGDDTPIRFLLSDQCFAQADVPPTETVNLWLGANVMLEYTVTEARNLLEKNVRTAEENVSELCTELEFVKDQITTTEVNVARVYNWAVQQRKANNPAGAK